MRYNMRHMVELYRRIAVLACFVCVLVCVGGCETVAKIFAPDDEVGAVDPQYFEGPRVRPGVALVIVVSAGGSAQPATMQVQVDQNGDLTLPLLLQSPVACDGLTLDALRQKLVKLYSDYYKQPQVTVTFAPYDGKGVSPWGTVTVLGEVASPGPVNMPSTMDLTVTKVLQAAGGLRPFADKSSIRVSRRDKDGKKTTYTIDIVEIGEKGRIEKDIVLRAGDVVWVPQTWY